MKLNSVASVVYYVSDLDATVKFYTDLGFTAGPRKENFASVRLNWSWVEFYTQVASDGPAMGQQMHVGGEGAFLGIKVDDAVEFHAGLVAKGLQPESEPQVKSGGKTEFVLKDPDGYRMLFFSKK